MRHAWSAPDGYGKAAHRRECPSRRARSSPSRAMLSRCQSCRQGQHRTGLFKRLAHGARRLWPEDSTFKEWSDRHGVPPNQRRLHQSAVGGDLKVCAPSSSFASPRLNDLIVCESGIGLSVGVSLFMPRSASRDAHHADTLPGVAHGGRTVRRRQGARPARAVAAAVLAGFAAASLQRQVAGLARPTPSRAMLAVSPPAAPARPTDYGTWSR